MSSDPLNTIRERLFAPRPSPHPAEMAGTASPVPPRVQSGMVTRSAQRCLTTPLTAYPSPRSPSSNKAGRCAQPGQQNLHRRLKVGRWCTLVDRASVSFLPPGIAGLETRAAVAPQSRPLRCAACGRCKSAYVDGLDCGEASIRFPGRNPQRCMNNQSEDEHSN